MALEFGWASIAELLDGGLMALAKAHYEEIALDQDKVPLAVDLDDFLAREASDTFKIFAAWDNGVLVGYVQWFFYSPGRYKTTLYVDDSAYYLAPEYRKGLTGYLFLKAAVAALPRPCRVQIREKETFKDGKVAMLLGRLGLAPVERVFSGFLED